MRRNDLLELKFLLLFWLPRELKSDVKVKISLSLIIEIQKREGKCQLKQIVN